MPKSKFTNEQLKQWKREINPAPIISARIKLQRDNLEWIACCPFHADSTPSFKVWKLDEGVWNIKCFGASCGWTGNVFQFVQKFDSLDSFMVGDEVVPKDPAQTSFVKAVERVLEEAGETGWEEGSEQEAVLPDAEEAPRKEKVTFTIEQYEMACAALEQSKPGQKWLSDRGITMQTARRLKLGFVQSCEAINDHHPWMTNGWVMFPTISDDGKIVTSIKLRSLVAKKQKLEPSGEISGILRAKNTSTTLYNLNAVRPDQDVWIVEGEPDVAVLTQAGLIAVGLPSASYRVTDDEIARLSTAKRRFMAGDQDDNGGGQKVMIDLRKRLSGETFDIKWLHKRKDANDVLTNEYKNDAKAFEQCVDFLRTRATQTETEAVVIDGDKIKPRRIKWLWQDKIPYGKITLFCGNPDNGKSLASSSMAFYVTTGTPFPGSDFSSGAADVLMLVGEDDLDDTAVPRLIAAGADMRRVHFIVSAKPVNEETREIRLDRDMKSIERTLEKNPNIKLLAIDPISNYLGEVSMVAEQEVRSILIPLKRLAEKFGCAVLIVMHLNKKSDLDAISRVGGAMAFIGVARCSWLFIRDQQEAPDGEEQAGEKKSADTFSMLRIKNNLVSANRAGMSYSVVTDRVEVEGEPDIIAPKIAWGGAIEGSADDALNNRARRGEAPNAEKRGAGRPNEKLQKAMEWLSEKLQDGAPHPVKILREEAKEAANITKETLDKAREVLGIEVSQTKQGWMWQQMQAGTQETDHISFE